MEAEDGDAAEELDLEKAEIELAAVTDEIFHDFQYLEFALQTVQLLLRTKDVSECVNERRPHLSHPLHSVEFLTATLIKYAKCILDYQCTERDLPIAHKALVGMVVVAKYYFFFPHPDPAVFPSLVKLLHEIFSDKKHFYPINYAAGQDSWPYIVKAGKSNKAASQTDTPLLQYVRFQELLLYNANAFGCDGFSAVLSHVKQSRVAFPLLLDIVRLFQSLGSLYSPFARETLLVPLRDAIFAFMLGMSDEEIRPLHNSDLDRLINSLEDLETSRRSHSKPFETFLLDFSLKCLRSSFLPKRLHGIYSIDQLAQLSLQREQLRQHRSEALQLLEPCISTSDLAAWIVKNEVLGIIFGKGTHHELIRRSKDILILLAKENALSDEIMDMMWDRGIPS